MEDINLDMPGMSTNDKHVTLVIISQFQTFHPCLPTTDMHSPRHLCWEHSPPDFRA